MADTPDGMTTDNDTLGQAMRDWRARQRLSQKAAAEVLGVPYGAWSRWERGENWPYSCEHDLLALIGVEKIDVCSDLTYWCCGASRRVGKHAPGCKHADD